MEFILTYHNLDTIASSEVKEVRNSLVIIPKSLDSIDFVKFTASAWDETLSLIQRIILRVSSSRSRICQWSASAFSEAMFIISNLYPASSIFIVLT